jgi:oligopeptide transport system ATP-binding protein
MPEVLLEVRDLVTTFSTPRGPLHAVDGVSFNLFEGEALGVVGESGSGKSVTALTLLRLFGPLARPRISGQALFKGKDLIRMSDAERQQVRGAQIGMVFQDPLTSLNPSLTVGEQIMETLRFHRGMSRGAARQRAAELLDLVGIPDAHHRLDDLPYRFSGGMRQRIMIAIAISCEPKLLIADEPTTALDVTVQAQVLALLHRLRRELGMALMLITHDFGVVAAICDTVQVMYAGRLVERGPLQQVLESPNHPYTEALLRLVPRLDAPLGERLEQIPGQPTAAIGNQVGCRFAPRCPSVADRCRVEDPPTFLLSGGQESACWFAEERRRPYLSLWERPGSAATTGEGRAPV